MNNYEDWAQLVAKKIKGEADIIAAIEQDELDDAAAANALTRALLEPFLPEKYGIGSGRVVDAFGTCSEYLDIVIYDRDFPRIDMQGAQSAYLYESVLAAFAVRAKFIRKTFFDSLNACASMSHLETRTDKLALVKLAKKNGMRAGPNGSFVHDDPLRSARFQLIGRPPVFVFGFGGIKHSHRQLRENIELWMENRRKVDIPTPMKAMPAVIATQGCFAWRNAAPLALSNREMLGIGNDHAPVRLIVLQLLYLLNRRLNVSTDSYGLKPDLKGYLSQFAAPEFEAGVGNLASVTSLGNAPSRPRPEQRAARDTLRFEQARDYAPPESPNAAARSRPAAESSIKTAVRSSAPESKPQAPKAAEPMPQQQAVFSKSSPFASAPSAVTDKPKTPQREPASPAPVSPLGSAPIPPMQKSAPGAGPASPLGSAPLGSAPIPPMKNNAPGASPASPPAAPLGSAPIPPMKNNARPNDEAQSSDLNSRKPPVDIDLGSASQEQFGGKNDELANTVVIPPGEDEFTSTVIVAPDPAPAKPENTKNSTDAFIARVKQQLSSSKQAKDSELDFSSTIPQ